MLSWPLYPQGLEPPSLPFSFVSPPRCSPHTGPARQADSHEKAQQRGRYEIAHLVDLLGVKPREESIESAHRLYKLGLQHGFTRGRRTNQVGKQGQAAGRGGVGWGGQDCLHKKTFEQA